MMTMPSVARYRQRPAWHVSPFLQGLDTTHESPSLPGVNAGFSRLQMARSVAGRTLA